MIRSDKDIIHKGLRLFWTSNCSNVSGIDPAFSRTLRNELVHLDSATSLSDIQSGLGITKRAKPLTGHTNRYSMEINGNWRLTFTCDDPLTGIVTQIDIEDLHRKGGAKKHS